MVVATQEKMSPSEMKSSKQWVCWKREEREGKPGPDGKPTKEITKILYNPATGGKAKANDHTTWSTYEQARMVCKRDKYDGIGFVFCSGYMLPVMGIDFDHCVNPETGEIEAWAWKYIQLLDSYTEYSPSGTGVHVLVIGEMPLGKDKDGNDCRPGRKRSFNKKEDRADGRREDAVIEMYSERRFFTITGKRVANTQAEIYPRQEQVLTMYEELFPNKKKAKPAPSPTVSKSLDLSDSELLDKAMDAKNGHLFRDLWHGSIAGYESQSQADQALCNLLAFWTGKDASRIDRLFRQSGLYRNEKWDRAARTGETYGEGTIRTAIDSCEEVYSKNAVSAIDEEDIFPEVQGDDPYPYIKFSPHAVEPKIILDCLEKDEIGDAILFKKLFRGMLVHDHATAEWYYWCGHYWKLDTINKIKTLLSGYLSATYLHVRADLSKEEVDLKAAIAEASAEGTSEDDPSLVDLTGKLKRVSGKIKALNGRARDLKSAKRCRNVLYFATTALGINSTDPDFKGWDNAPWLLATQQGTIDLHTGKLRNGSPRDFIRTVTTTIWKGIDAPCPRWDRFLQEIFEDRCEQERTELITFLQRALGYASAGQVLVHFFLMLYGAEGRNGKDTLLETISNVLQSHVSPVSKDVLLDTGKAGAAGSATPHLIALRGRRLAWASEPTQGARFDVAQVKYLTGGGKITGRQLHQKQITFDPTHLLVILTNHKPHADAKDTAFWNRICPVTFNLRFVDDEALAENERLADPYLKTDLAKEASGILAWLVRGCLEFQRIGISIPKSIKRDRQKYKDEEDTMKMFTQDCCVIDKARKVQSQALYNKYKAWCEEQSIKPMTGTRFGLEIGKDYTKKRYNDGKYYLGIDIRGEFDPLPPDEDEEDTKDCVQDHHKLYTHDKSASQATSENVTDERVYSVYTSARFSPHRENEEDAFAFKPDLTIHTIHSQNLGTSESASQATPQRVYSLEKQSPECMELYTNQSHIPQQLAKDNPLTVEDTIKKYKGRVF